MAVIAKGVNLCQKWQEFAKETDLYNSMCEIPHNLKIVNRWRILMHIEQKGGDTIIAKR